MLSDQKLPGYRFPLAMISYAVWLYHRFTLSCRDVEELEEFASRMNPSGRGASSSATASSKDEMHVNIGGIKHWLWRAVDEHAAVLDVFLQEHRDTQAATSFFHRLLGEYDVPQVIHTDKLWSDGAAIRELPVLHPAEHVQVISTARCNNLVEQSHRPTRRQERQQWGFRSRQWAQGFLALHARITNLHHPARSTVPARQRRHHQQAAFATWQETVWQAT